MCIGVTDMNELKRLNNGVHLNLKSELTFLLPLFRLQNLEGIPPVGKYR